LRHALAVAQDVTALTAPHSVVDLDGMRRKLRRRLRRLGEPLLLDRQGASAGNRGGDEAGDQRRAPWEYRGTMAIVGVARTEHKCYPAIYWTRAIPTMPRPCASSPPVSRRSCWWRAWWPARRLVPRSTCRRTPRDSSGRSFVVWTRSRARPRTLGSPPRCRFPGP